MNDDLEKIIKNNFNISHSLSIEYCLEISQCQRLEYSLILWDHLLRVMYTDVVSHENCNLELLYACKWIKRGVVLLMFGGV